MDEWIVLSPNRWKLKNAIQIVNQTLNELKFEKHLDKTFIGQIAKGFDFLGYNFEPKGLSIAPKTLLNFLDRKTQLYEQDADYSSIGYYVKNCWRWVRTVVEFSERKRSGQLACPTLSIAKFTHVNHETQCLLAIPLHAF